MKTSETAPMPKATGAPEQQDDKRHDQDEAAGEGRAHGTTSGFTGLSSFMPKGGSRPVTRQISSTTYCRRQDAKADRHRRIGNPQPLAPHRVRVPVLGPRLVPEIVAEHRHDEDEGERQQDREQRQPVAQPRTGMERQHVDIDVAARHQHIGAADEGGGNQAVGDEIGLPDRVGAEHRALEHHLADDEDAERDQACGEDAAGLRDSSHRLDERFHPQTDAPTAAPDASAWPLFHRSASSSSFWPFGTSLA